MLEYLANRPDEARLPPDPARIFIDRGGFRYAYLPHLIGAEAGASAITLIALDAEFGPKITDIETDFYRSDPINDNTFAGGSRSRSGPATRPTPRATPVTARAPRSTRPTASGRRAHLHRARGARRDRAGGDQALVGVNPDAVGGPPVHGGTSRSRTPRPASACWSGTPRRRRCRWSTRPSTRTRTRSNPQIASVSLCRNPNVLAIDRPPVGENLALISCYSDDKIAVVGLGAFQVINTITVDDGPNGAGRRRPAPAALRRQYAGELDRRRLARAAVARTTCGRRPDRPARGRVTHAALLRRANSLRIHSPSWSPRKVMRVAEHELLDRLVHRARGLVAVVDVARERLEQDLLERVGDPRVESRWGAGPGTGAPRRRSRGRCRGEQPARRQQLEEHDAEREHVAAVVELCAADLLGRHVRELALDDAAWVCTDEPTALASPKSISLTSPSY